MRSFYAYADWITSGALVIHVVCLWKISNSTTIHPFYLQYETVVRYHRRTLTRDFQLKKYVKIFIKTAIISENIQEHSIVVSVVIGSHFLATRNYFLIHLRRKPHRAQFLTRPNNQRPEFSNKSQFRKWRNKTPAIKTVKTFKRKIRSTKSNTHVHNWEYTIIHYRHSLYVT